MHASTAGTRRVGKKSTDATLEDPQPVAFLPIFLADCVTRTLLNGFYVLKVGQQTSKGNVSFSQIEAWYRQEKLGGLLRGNLAACARLWPFALIKSLTNQVLVKSTRSLGSAPQWGLAVEGLSTFVAAAATYPFNTLQTRMTVEQAETANYIAIVRGMFNEPAGLIGGLWAGWMVVLPGNLFHHLGLYISDKFLNAVGFPTPKVVDLSTFTRNALQSAFAHFLAYPFDTVCVRMQLGMFDSVWECVTETYRNEGITGFYKGLWITLLKVLPYAILMYSSFEISKRFFDKRGKYYRYFKRFRDVVSGHGGNALG